MKECFQVAVGISEYTRLFSKAFVPPWGSFAQQEEQGWRMKTGMIEEVRRSGPPVIMKMSTIEMQCD